MASVAALRFDGVGRSWGPLPVGNRPRVLSGGPPPKRPGDGRRWFLAVMVVVLLASLLAVAPAALRTLPPTSGDDAAPAEQGVSAALGATPLAFVENRGQVDGPVSYYVQGSDTSLYFTPEGVTFALSDDASSHADDAAPGAVPERWAVKLDFVGANSVAPTGIDRAEATVSYLGTEAASSQTAIPTYSSMVYEELWPGIDMVYEATGSQLKYSFVVHPGADPSKIRLAYRGATGVTLNDAGQIAVTTPAGGFADDKPYTYQDIDGQRVAVPSAYALERGAEAGSATFGIPVGAYDRTKDLIIDPTVLVYTGFLGGSGDDNANSVAVDGDGSAYVTGVTSSPDFPATVGPAPTAGYAKAYVVKINPAGTGFVYAAFLDGGGNAIAVDHTGHAYVGGQSNSAGAPVPADSQLTPRGGSDGYVVKLNQAGTGVVYAAYLGGTDRYERVKGIAVDDGGHAYVVGEQFSSDGSGDGFPVTVGPDLTFNGGSQDAFVAKLHPSGASLVYAGYIGGKVNDVGNGIAVDGAGNAYVVGETNSSEASFPVTVGPDLSYNGGRDAFVAKVDASGSSLAYAGYIGGSDADGGGTMVGQVGRETGAAIAVDAAGSAYVTGETMSTEATFPVTEEGPDATFNGFGDAYITKVAPTGGSFIYSGYIGGGSADLGQGVAVDGTGNAYVTGRTNSYKEFPLVDGPDLIYGQGGGSKGAHPFVMDAFVTKLNSAGTSIIYSGYIGGAGDDSGNGIAVDGTGNAYIAGSTSARYLGQAETNVLAPRYGGGNSDGFVAKVGEGTAPRSQGPQ